MLAAATPEPLAPTTATPEAPTPQGIEWLSQYVPMSDGTRLAVDIRLPAGRSPGDAHPTLITLTRYIRSRRGADGSPLSMPMSSLERVFLDNGYALVTVDVRGSGASYGSRPAEYGDQEVRDGYDLVEWAVSQDWSDGTVGAYGTSYTGTTAELLAASNHPAVKAVIPGWSDFDLYVSPARPYGVVARNLIATWSRLVGAMDDNNTAALGGTAVCALSTRTSDGELRDEAVLAHAANPDVYEMVEAAEFRDDAFDGTHPWAVGPIRWKAEIEASDVPMLVLASWLDAGTADGALHRFRTFSNPQTLVLMATTHGGFQHASPYVVGNRPAPQPSVAEQNQLQLDFFDYHLKGVANGIDDAPAVRYYTLGEEAFRETDVWPPAGTRRERLWMAGDARLSEQRPTHASGSDAYQVDFGVSTGGNNRWMAQLAQPVLNLDRREAMDARMLTYTSEPLDADLVISGTPTVTLQLSSDHTDGLVLAYLEDVDPEGRSRYLTEGGLRLIHRKLSTNPLFPQATPYHSFERADATPDESR